MRLNDREFDLSQPQVMAIVNVTPDSFFEQSRVANDETFAFFQFLMPLVGWACVRGMLA